MNKEEHGERFSLTVYGPGHHDAVSATNAGASSPVTPTSPSSGNSIGTLGEVAPGSAQFVAPNGELSPGNVTATDQQMSVSGEGVTMSLKGATILHATTNPTPEMTTGTVEEFSGSGYWPNSTIEITAYSRGLVLGVAKVGVNGTFTIHITLPSTLASGSHTIVSKGVAKSGSPIMLAMGIVLQRPFQASLTLSRFAQGAWWLSPTMKALLARLAFRVATTREHGTITVVVAGYSNSWGGAREDVLISRQRALVVANFLRARMALFAHRSPVRITIRAMGERNPVDSNSTVAGRASNQRVVINARGA